MTELKITSLSNKWHYLAILVVLSALVFVSPWTIVLIIIYLYFLYSTDIFFIGIITLIFSFFTLFINHQNASSLDVNQEIFEVKIIDYTRKTYGYEILVKHNKEYILVRYNKTFDFKSGDIVEIEGKLNLPSEGSFEGDFDYAKYLKNKGIHYILRATSIKKIKSTFHINQVKNSILDYYSTKLSQDTYSYISSLVFANKIFDAELNQSITSIGLSYLFAISGMHIILIYGFLKKILKKIIFDEQIIIKITLVILLIYTILLQSNSVNRAYLMILLMFLSKKYRWHQTKLDVLSISLIILFLYKPLSIYEVSFILSFLVTFVLILVSKLISDNNIIRQTYKITLLSFFVSLPIIINMNNQINLITLIISPLLAVLYSVIILPVTYISLVIPIDLFKPIFGVYNNLISIVSNINLFEFNYKYINVEVTLIYYLFLFIVLKKLFNKEKVFYKILGFLGVLILFNNINLLNPYTRVTFIDVGQGDSTYVELAFNKGNVMIDSYGKNLSYLKSLGINKLDYLVITHHHLDHFETANDVLKDINVKNVVINSYDSIYDYELIGNFNIIKVKADDVLNIGGIDFHIISPSIDSNNKNNLSIGLYFDVGLKFLLTGDMEKEAEMLALNKYGDKLDSDVYKVGHHGSNTSSSIEFINVVTPKYSIISAGFDNRYNFPHSQTLDNLKESKIFITFKTGNIDFYLFKNNYNVKTYR